VVVGEHGWWQSCAEIGARGYDPFGPQSARFNLIIGTAARDPVSGTPSHRSYSVRNPARRPTALCAQIGDAEMSIRHCSRVVRLLQVTRRS